MSFYRFCSATIAVIVVSFLCLSASYWQFQRYVVQGHLLAQQGQDIDHYATHVSDYYQKVCIATAEWVPEQLFWVETLSQGLNKMYAVVVPIKTVNQQVMPVVIGLQKELIAATITLPKIDKICGMTRPFQTLSWGLSVHVDQRRSLWSHLTIVQFKQQFPDSAITDWMLVADSLDTGGVSAYPPITPGNKINQHLSYAFQWFIFFLLTIFFYIFFLFRDRMITPRAAARFKLIGFLFFCIIPPFIAAILYLYFPQFIAVKNSYGQQLSLPPIQWANYNISGSSLQNCWVLAVAYPESCNEECWHFLEIAERLQRAEGRYAHRICLVQMLRTPPVETIVDNHMSDLLQKFTTIQSDQLSRDVFFEQPGFYVINPLGVPLLHWSFTQSPYEILSDFDKLLKAPVVHLSRKD